MASNYQNYGTITTNTTTDSVACRGWATLSAHLDSGSGTWTWQFKGPDGVWRDIYAGADNGTLLSFSDTHMVNVFFGGDMLVRGNATGGTSPQWDWQIVGNLANRG